MSSLDNLHVAQSIDAPADVQADILVDALDRATSEVAQIMAALTLLLAEEPQLEAHVIERLGLDGVLLSLAAEPRKPVRSMPRRPRRIRRRR